MKSIFKLSVLIFLVLFGAYLVPVSRLYLEETASGLAFGTGDVNSKAEVDGVFLIADQGGIGRYPGTQVVHIDLRGKRARWDSY